MKQYLDLLQRTLDHGTLKPNRTGTPAITLPGGAMMQFDLRQGLPVVTTKKVNFDAVKGELLGFIGGCTSAADFRALGCNIWNANANDPGKPGSPNAWLESPFRKGEDDLGRIYGAQWRGWRRRVWTAWGSEDRDIDQLAQVIEKIMLNPQDRRIIMSAWRPDEFEQMALPPCHVLYQFTVDGNYLDLCMYQRSCDMFLGVPFNVASCGLLLALVALATDKRPRLFTHFLADVHIYENHVEQVKEQLTREPYALPYDFKLETVWPYKFGDTPADRLRWLESLEPQHIQLPGYEHHPPITGQMAV